MLHDTAVRATPAKLAQLSQQLHMPEAAVQDLVERCPALLSTAAEDLDRQLHWLARELGVTLKTAIFMASKQPALISGERLGQLREHVQLLAQLLGVHEADVVKLATHTPSVLKRPALPLAAKLKKVKRGKAACGLSLQALLMSHFGRGMQSVIH